MPHHSLVLSNQLHNQKSPYLLKHAHNPVAWQPWSESTLCLAKTHNRPIFLSIGYSTCHWCHVMAHESFEDQATAQVLNTHFIPIKVDREERPDIDSIYMAYVIATTGHGGWPMSVFLTPDLHPFFGGTYFPPENNRYGRPSFLSILKKIADLWSKHHHEIAQKAQQTSQHLFQAHLAPHPTSVTTAPLLSQVLPLAIRQAQQHFDPIHGGFSTAPKFPRPALLSFLLQASCVSHSIEKKTEPTALTMAERTLESMAYGGIHDHLGGGFHRYSVDARWHIPHYEKMLYDQGQLLTTYAQAYALTQKQLYLDTAQSIALYIQQHLTSPQGAFYSAEDADSPRPDNPQEHGEGAYYTWRQTELKSILSEKEFHLISLYYNIRPEGNALPESDPHGELKEFNTLAITTPLESIAQKLSIPLKEAATTLQQAKQKLLQKRQQRPSPHLDDKIITAWNAYTISGLIALANAAPHLAPSLLPRAIRAAEFILQELIHPHTGHLLRAYRQGPSPITAFAIDYAATIAALLDLYIATAHPSWLRQALALQTQMDSLFWDPQQGNYYNETAHDPTLLYRTRGDDDHAEPSANSIAALNLIRIANLLQNNDRREQARCILCSLSHLLQEVPHAAPYLATALIHYSTPPTHLIIAGPTEHPLTRALHTEARRHIIPALTILIADQAENSEFLASYIPSIRQFKPIQGRPTAYCCREFTCTSPLQSVAELSERLTRSLHPSP
jgi:uncharacterized protein YyaL (SSP411 family)